MAFPDSVAGGFSGQALTNSYSGTFIPTIWSGKIIERFYDATVLAAIANTDYEGEISGYGDTVEIRGTPDISINDYSADANLAFERPSEPVVTLSINKGKYFNTILDDVYKLQADINMLDLWADAASEKMKVTIDKDVLTNIAATAHANNRGTTAGRISGNINLGAAAAAVTITSGNVLDMILNLGQVLDEQNVPETGRWCVLPAWMVALVKKSDLRDASLSGDGTSIMRNGRLGMIDRFTLYLSNNLPVAGAEYTIYAGQTTALTFASQLTNVETLRSEHTFGTVLRGLQVYGYKTVKPESLAEAVVSP